MQRSKMPRTALREFAVRFESLSQVQGRSLSSLRTSSRSYPSKSREAETDASLEAATPTSGSATRCGGRSRRSSYEWCIGATRCRCIFGRACGKATKDGSSCRFWCSSLRPTSSWCCPTASCWRTEGRNDSDSAWSTEPEAWIRVQPRCQTCCAWIGVLKRPSHYAEAFRAEATRRPHAHQLLLD